MNSKAESNRCPSRPMAVASAVARARRVGCRRGARLAAPRRRARRARGRRSRPRRSSRSSSDPSRCIPTTSSRSFCPRRPIRCKSLQAARFLEDRKTRLELEPDDDWDDSVVALLNYPEVVKLMNDDLDWTYELGEAVLNQRADVLERGPGFPRRAYAAGNLRTDDRQTVRATTARSSSSLRTRKSSTCRTTSRSGRRYQRRRSITTTRGVSGVLLPVSRAATLRHRLFLGRAQLVLGRLALAPRARLRPVLSQPSVLRLELLRP